MIHVKHVGGGLYEICGTTAVEEKCHLYEKMKTLNLPDVLKGQLERDAAFCKRRMARKLRKKQAEIDELKRQLQELKEQNGR